MNEITDQKRLEAARIARELADKVGSGMEFGTTRLYKDGKPCCALGQLHYRLGLEHKPTLRGEDDERDYEALSNIVGFYPKTAPGYNKRAPELSSIYGANDCAFGNRKDISLKEVYVKNLKDALRRFADKAESVAKENLRINSHSINENAPHTIA